MYQLLHQASCSTDVRIGKCTYTDVMGTEAVWAFHHHSVVAPEYVLSRSYQPRVDTVYSAHVQTLTIMCYSVSQKKLDCFSFEHNYCPILTIISLLQTN